MTKDRQEQDQTRRDRSSNSGRAGVDRLATRPGGEVEAPRRPTDHQPGRPDEPVVEDASGLLSAGIGHHQAGRLHEAEICYRRALAGDPALAEGWHRLGLLARESGRADAALEAARRAATLRPDEAEYRFSLGRAWLGVGRLDEAMGVLREAVQRRPDRVDGLNELGIALARAGRTEEALGCLELAIRHRPDLASAHQNLAVVFRRLGRLAEAERSFLRAGCLDPSAPEAQLGLGLLWQAQGRLVEAQVAFRNAIRLDPGRAEGHQGLGHVLFDLGRADAASESFRQALARTPDDPETLNDLGNALRQLDRTPEATEAYRMALKANPDFSPALSNLGNLYSEEGKTEEAREAYRRSHQIRPLDRLRLLYELLLPVIYNSADHVDASREQFVESLKRLHDDGVRIDPTRELVPTHFYLAYQGRNDRDLHASIARLAKCPPSPDRCHRPSTGRKIRVGFLSSYLRSHTIGQLNHGLIAQLDRSRFEVVVLSAGPPDPGLGARIRRSADRFVVVPSQLEAALRTVAEQELDILYFTDIGMDTLTYTMAFSRLAPVQCATWGHPVTTGVPNVDYFLSTDDLEVEVSESQYTEKLVRLPRLNVYYERPSLVGAPPHRAAFGLPDEAHIYLCPQTLFKFHPEFDGLLGEILRADPDGLLVLIEGKYPHWTERLRSRFERSFPDVLERVRFLPKLGRDDFLKLLAVSDVMLDPIHFGGGNTSYEALSLGLPIVTWPSAYLRGRLTYAMYRQMGMTDLVAEDASHYVRLAVRLGTDRPYRLDIRRRLDGCSGALFDDVEAVRAVERFLLAASEAAASLGAIDSLPARETSVRVPASS